MNKFLCGLSLFVFATAVNGDNANKPDSAITTQFQKLVAVMFAKSAKYRDDCLPTSTGCVCEGAAAGEFNDELLCMKSSGDLKKITSYTNHPSFISDYSNLLTEMNQKFKGKISLQLANAVKAKFAGLKANCVPHLEACRCLEGETAVLWDTPSKCH